MRLQLTRPLAFIDIEGTGVNPENDRIVELSVTKLFPDGSRENKTRRYNPGIEIPQSAIDIHGITNEAVATEHPFSYTAKGLLKYLDGCDIAGFASNRYDVPLLFTEFRRADLYWDYTKFKMVDAGVIFKIQEPRTLEAAVQYYCGKNLEGAHGAEADVNATVDVLLAQIEKYDTLPVTVDELALFSNYDKPVLDLSGKFSTDDAGDIIFNFGPHKGKKATEDLSFVQWMLKKDFAEDTMRICEEILTENNLY
ncbi:3'-5' exonuclease [Pedobacter sp. Leaf170]|uniref:3'-5' exonuclease n=1 Tax=Pedobacter sp. Leaf170 TaxID=2876558 RepID=UPI001E3BA55E|nr:3'-5' exonuclease [Pedobacter sp. Leaf170]